jgi:DNA-binding CsgD family transcriptional regulator/tetratricopeptide (TPR) repeat protein
LRDNLEVTRRLSYSELVGRRSELTEVTALFESGRSTGATVLVGGEAGIGKTRLIGEICARARHSGHVTAVGACVPVESRVLAYASLVGLLRDLERQFGGRPEAADLRVAMQAIRMSPARPSIADGDPSADRITADSPHSAPSRQMAKALIYELIAVALMSLSNSSPVVVVFEDIHWADTFTLGLLDYLTRNMGDSPVLIIASYRSDELGKNHPLRALLAELMRLERVLRIELFGLQGQELEALMTGILGHRPKRALLDLMSARTGGNPFFVEELLSVGVEDVSDDLREVVMARVRRLENSAQRLLDVAATIGSRVDHGLLAEVCALDDDDLDLAIEEVVGSHFLIVDNDAKGYRFRHDLVREALYGSLLPGERVRLHRRVATTLSAHPELGPNDPGWLATQLASHWWEAGAFVEVLPACAAAAEEESAMFAFAEAQLHLDRALAAWDRLGDEVASSVVGIDRAALLEQAADAAYFADSGRRPTEVAQQAIDAVDEHSDPRRKAMGYVRLARNASNDDLNASLTALEAAASLVPSEEPSLELSRILTEQARVLMLMSRFGEAQALAEHATEISHAVGNRSAESQNFRTSAVCLVEFGRFDEAIALSRQSVAIAEKIDTATDLGRSYNILVHVLSRAGRLEEGAAVTLDTLAKGERLGGIRLQGAALNSIDALIQLGRCAEASRLLNEIEGRTPGLAHHFAMTRATLHLRQGRFAAAAAALERLDELTVDLSDLQYRGVFHMLRAELALEEGRPSSAFCEVELALAQAAGTDDQVLTSEMCALGIRALADQRDEAHQRQWGFDENKASLLAAELIDRAQVLVDLPRQRGTQPLPRAEAFALQCRAEATRLSVPEAALWEASATRWEGLGERYFVAYCHWRPAQALLAARSAPTRSAKCLLYAWRISVDIGATHLQAKAEALAQRARINLGAESPRERRTSQVAGDLGLTSREVEVLGYLASGKTDGQIAEDLFISKKTASVHVSNLLRKLRVENRRDAAEIGRQYGLSLDASTLAGSGILQS